MFYLILVLIYLVMVIFLFYLGVSILFEAMSMFKEKWIEDAVVVLIFGLIVIFSAFVYFFSFY